MSDPYEQYLSNAWEQHVAECEFHEGNSKYDCEECEAAYEEYCELQGDADREERASRV